MRTLFLLLAVIVIAYAKPYNKGAKLCSFCKSFVNGIESGLVSEEKDIEALANRLCDALCKDNSALDSICRGLIDDELEAIIDWLVKNETPEVVCHQLHLC